MDEIYQKYGRTVFKYLMSLTHDSGLSEELTQETFFQAIRTVDTYDESCPVTTWLCGIAKNVLRTWRRKNPPAAEISETDSTGISGEEEVLQSMRRTEIMKKLHAMEDPWREILYLRIYADLSFKEIGEIHGKSENWARVTYYRAKEKLRKDLESDI